MQYLQELSDQEILALWNDYQKHERIAKAGEHPSYFLKHVRAFDPETQEEFRFGVEDDSPWSWQRDLLEWWHSNSKTIVLKARQLGITWLASGYALWQALYRPGSRILIFSTTEQEASKVMNRIWDLMHSLERDLWNGAKILKPTKNARPYTEIILNVQGRTSSIIAFPSSKKAGHGETASMVILDEYSRHEYAQECWKAVIPTTSKGGKVLVISTANGISHEGRGNYFHHLWSTAEEKGIKQRFLAWNLHPLRDDEWYQREAMALPPEDRGEQYPRDEYEAFILTGRRYFDESSLDWYRNGHLIKPKFRGKFILTGTGKAQFRFSDTGCVYVYYEPHVDENYVIAADVATGKGSDYSSAIVLCLSDLSICAEIHGKIGMSEYSDQLHCLGRWYNTALIAPEQSGGYGYPIVVSLKDGKDGRPPYPRLYMHKRYDRADRPISQNYGYPITQNTRSLVIAGLERALREREFPYLTSEILKECDTFVHKDTLPSPRAQDGCNDDRVMALAIATELFRMYGKPKKRKKQVVKPPLPTLEWQ